MLENRISYDELRRTVQELEKSAKSLPYRPPHDEGAGTVVAQLLTFDDLLNELDKLYKIRKAKMFFKRK